MVTDLRAVIAREYPLALTCSHLKRLPSLERELEDDRYQYIIVMRCVNCWLPGAERYATEEEIEKYRDRQ